MRKSSAVVTSLGGFPSAKSSVVVGDVDIQI